MELVKMNQTTGVLRDFEKGVPEILRDFRDITPHFIL